MKTIVIAIILVIANNNTTGNPAAAYCQHSSVFHCLNLLETLLITCFSFYVLQAHLRYAIWNHLDMAQFELARAHLRLLPSLFVYCRRRGILCQPAAMHPGARARSARCVGHVLTQWH